MSSKTRGNRSDRSVSGHPAGVTLIEMMIVLAIVAVLAALTIGALIKIPEVARARGTEALISKIDAKLSQMLNEFNLRRESIQTIQADLDLSRVAATPPPHPNRARVISITRNLRQEFPEFFLLDTNRTTDSVNNDGDFNITSGTALVDEPDEIIQGHWNILFSQTWQELPPAAISHLRYIERAFADPDNVRNGIPFATVHAPGTARAECLYMIVTKGGTDTAEFSEDEMRDTDGDGLREFVDKWGRPIQFFLWPTHYDSPAQKPGAEANMYDPQQLLTEEVTGSTPWWSDSLGGQQFAIYFHSLSKDITAALAPPAPNLNQVRPAGYNTHYLIISAGSDQGFGFVTAGLGDDGVMGTLDDIGTVDKRVIRITDPLTDGYGMDSDNIDNHHLRAR